VSARRTDLLVGIVLGIVVGLAVVAVFVFVGSEGTIDSPGINGVNTGKPPAVKTVETSTTEQP
jgi:hypothetical protein